MNTLKNLRLGSLMLLLLLAMGCSLQDEEPLKIADESSDDVTAKIAHLRQINQDEPIYLSGVQNYYTYAVKTKEVLQDGDVPCLAMLDFLEGQNIMLSLTEYPGTEFERTSNFIGKMTPSGQITFTFPMAFIVDVIQAHSGCEVYGGRGVNEGNLIYQGSFDGERLLASAPFYSKCEEWTLIPPARPIEGPVHWEWTIDLTVD